MPSTTLHPPFEAYNGDEPFLFVSYAHKDSAEVFPELVALRGMGVRIWYDEGIDPGNEWPEEIEAALKKSAMFLVFITPNAVASQNVRNEINFALNNHVPFLAVHLTETELVKGLALRMGDIQAVLKHRMSPESYWRKMEKVLPMELREPEREPVAEEEPTPQWEPEPIPEPAVPPQRAWQQPALAHSMWQRVIQLPRRPLLIGAASVVLLGVIVSLMMNRTPKPEGYVEPPSTVLPLNVATTTKHTPWTNTLGMKFVPSGTPGVLISIWETRVQDYEAFVKGKWLTWEKPSFAQGPTHPVENVSYLDAVAFCEWLSKKEGKTYRLPTDAEWSAAVELAGETGATPKEKEANGNTEIFPWGTAWPPPEGAGNFADDTAKKANSGFGYLDGYADGFAHTSPAGTFTKNSLGIYDLSGNALEWCQDLYEPTSTCRVVRGGSSLSNGRGRLASSARDGRTPVSRDGSIGFRCVVVIGSSP